MNYETVGIKEFSKKLFFYLNLNTPIILKKRNKLVKLLQPISPEAMIQISKEEKKCEVINHPAIGIWKSRYKKESSVSLAKKVRKKMEKRNSNAN
jgi:hypothetical protein